MTSTAGHFLDSTETVQVTSLGRPLASSS